MAPFDLDGLNVVQPVQQDTQDLAPPFPDFSAHLDLWTNLEFDSDDSPTHKRKLQDDHVLGSPQLDINALLAGVGIDPSLIPTPPPVQRAVPAPSLAQLLALHAAHSTYTAPPPATTASTSTSNSLPSKRSRVHKTPSHAETDPSETYSPSSPTSEEQTQSATSLSAAEDKRRRNTAASARFRLKKKEREAALERHAKELEDRIVDLERECEGLRRENGWLKGLVVGVTGAGAAQHQQVAPK